MKVTKIVMIALLLLILYQVTMGRSVSRMGADLDTVQGSMAASGPSSIFGLKNKLSCVAGGFNPNSSWYSKDLTPGGLCGDNDWIRNQQRDFEIKGGIGGSLLAK
jgi:hypothetical protein